MEGRNEWRDYSIRRILVKRPFRRDRRKAIVILHAVRHYTRRSGIVYIRNAIFTKIQLFTFPDGNTRRTMGRAFADPGVIRKLPTFEPLFVLVLPRTKRMQTH